MVKVGTTQLQRQLFFRSQGKHEERDRGAVEETLEEDISNRGESAIFVPAEARRKRAQRELGQAGRDFSLDAVIDSTNQLTYLDLLPSDEPQQEEELARHEIMSQVAEHLSDFAATLPEKELYIFQHRLLTDEPETLQEIGERYGVSRERIRQIESGLKKRIHKLLRDIDGVSDLAR